MTSSHFFCQYLYFKSQSKVLSIIVILMSWLVKETLFSKVQIIFFVKKIKFWSHGHLLADLTCDMHYCPTSKLYNSYLFYCPHSVTFKVWFSIPCLIVFSQQLLVLWSGVLSLPAADTVIRGAALTCILGERHELHAVYKVSTPLYITHWGQVRVRFGILWQSG